MSHRGIHIVLTGPPCSGKSTLMQVLKRTSDAACLDTLTFHDTDSQFTRDDAALAFNRYLDELSRIMPQAKLVISEGVFISDDRRAQLTERTKAAGLRIVPITLLSEPAILQSRLASRNAVSARQVLWEHASQIEGQLRSRPWGASLDTSYVSVDRLAFRVQQLATTDLGITSPLVLYLDNLGVEAITSLVGRAVPETRGREFLRAARLIDAVVYADEVALTHYDADQAYCQSVSGLTELRDGTDPTWRFSLLRPDVPTVMAMRQAALARCVDQLHQLQASGLLTAVIVRNADLPVPARVAAYSGQLQKVYAALGRGREMPVPPPELGAVAWFVEALDQNQGAQTAIRKILRLVQIPPGTSWQFVHRLFRCFAHYWAAHNQYATYWPAHDRNALIQSGAILPIEQLNAGVADIALEIAPLPVWGACVLLRLSGQLVTKDALMREIEALRRDPGVTDLSLSVRQFHDLVLRGPAAMKEAWEIQSRVQGILESLQRVVGIDRRSLPHLSVRFDGIPERHTSAPDGAVASHLAWVVTRLGMEPRIARPPLVNGGGKLATGDRKSTVLTAAAIQTGEQLRPLVEAIAKVKSWDVFAIQNISDFAISLRSKSRKQHSVLMAHLLWAIAGEPMTSETPRSHKAVCVWVNDQITAQTELYGKILGQLGLSGRDEPATWQKHCSDISAQAAKFSTSVASNLDGLLRDLAVKYQDRRVGSTSRSVIRMNESDLSTSD